MTRVWMPATALEGVENFLQECTRSAKGHTDVWFLRCTDVARW